MRAPKQMASYRFGPGFVRALLPRWGDLQAIPLGNHLAAKLDQHLAPFLGGMHNRQGIKKVSKTDAHFVSPENVCPPQYS